MTARKLDALIVGAGFAGLYQLHSLRRIGLSARVIEAGSGVGGTWYWNRYPGARCDVPSMDYCYSFSPELEQEWTWSERYATQPEILRYIEHVADRFDLRRDVQFDTRVVAAVYNEAQRRWTVTTDGGEEFSVQFLITATGCLSVPKSPEVPGVERFQGQSYHTGRWPRHRVDFARQRVAVIGTGSSGIQSIPMIAEQAASVVVFQRTPNFAVPARNRPLTEDEVRERKATYREYRQALRQSGLGAAGVAPTKSALDVDPDDRLRTYESRWSEGRIAPLLTSYTDILTSSEANETLAEFVRTKIQERIVDPETAEVLTPRTYPFGTKRPCLDTNFYETFNLDHVQLVDLRRTPLIEITETGVRTAARHFDVDAVVFASGFDAMTGALTAIDIRGRAGASLREKWSGGPVSYLGLAVAGFPNLFTVTGPTSPSVLSNMVMAIEQHVDWITNCITWMREHDLEEIDATAEAESDWVKHAEEVGNATLYPLADSWYLGANVPGKPRVFMAYVAGLPTYTQRCKDVADNGYAGFDATPAPDTVEGRQRPETE